MEKAITFLVVDDHPVFRQGLVALIASQERYKVCGEAGSEAEALTVLPTSPSSTFPSWVKADSIW
jgi:DNA-binding NarL/FixJ family response regulator